MKNVLIALDYDPSAQEIAEQGFALASSMNAKVTLLHVLPHEIPHESINFPIIMGFYANNYFNPEINTDLMEGARSFLQKTKEHLGNENINILTIKGDVAGSIIEIALKMPAQIIVLGTHSRRWLEKILVGSVTEKLLEDTTIPLFIIPTKKKKNR